MPVLELNFLNLCEDSGYLWNSEVYIGKEINNTDCISPGKSNQISWKV